MSARGPSSVQPRRSSPRRNNRGPSSAPPAPRRTRTYISIFQTKYGPNTARGAATNPHRVYGFINNSTGEVHIISGNSMRNSFRNVVENNPRIMRNLRRRFRIRNLPPHYARNIAANILPVREQASINATNQYSRRLQHLNQERKAQNKKLNRNLDMKRISWANYAEKTNKYIRNRFIENARLKKDYNESRATHQFEIELWRKIQRLVQLYGSNANYTKRAITISNRQTRKFMKLQTNLQSRARRTLVS